MGGEEGTKEGEAVQVGSPPPQESTGARRHHPLSGTGRMGFAATCLLFFIRGDLLRL